MLLSARRHYVILLFSYFLQHLSTTIQEQNALLQKFSPDRLKKTSMKEKHLAYDQEIRLRKRLFKEQSYNPLILPIKQLNDTMIVELKVYLNQIIHLEEKSQIMKTNVWLHMVWSDYQLSWKEEDYGGINLIVVRPELIWRPDIVLFNNADGKYKFDWLPNVLLYSGGRLTWIPPAIYNSSCTIEVQYFPFDQQQCELKFGSLAFDADQLNFKMMDNESSLDLSGYFKSGTWDLIDVPGKIVTQKKDGKKTVQIIYSIKLRRKTLFYTVNLILPCIMISMLSICVFYLPADAGEKMTLCISILFALVVFLLLISKILPPTSTSIPLISRYLLFTFIINIFAILLTMVIIKWNYQSRRSVTMPRWVRYVFMEFFPRFLCLKRPIHVERDLWLKKNLKITSQNLNSIINSPELKASFSSPINTTHDLDEYVITNDKCKNYSESDFQSHLSTSPTSFNSLDSDERSFSLLSSKDSSNKLDYCSSSTLNGESATMTTNNVVEDIINEEIGNLAKSVSYISSNMYEGCEIDNMLSDWKFVASVLDRLMLILFTVITVLGTVSIFTKAPFIFDTDNHDVSNIDP